MISLLLLGLLKPERFIRKSLFELADLFAEFSFIFHVLDTSLVKYEELLLVHLGLLGRDFAFLLQFNKNIVGLGGLNSGFFFKLCLV